MDRFALLLVIILVRLQLFLARESAILLEKNGKEAQLPIMESDTIFESSNLEAELHLAHSSFTNGDIRLAQDDESYSDNPTSGRLELYIDTLLDSAGSGDDSIGTWGTVCGLGFTFKAANVACRQLGFAAATGFELSSSGLNGSVPIFLEGVACSRKGWSHLMRCRASSPTFLNCTHDHDVTVHCNSTPIWTKPYRGQVRLVGANSTSPSSVGRVEVYQADVWGTVCNQDFSQAAADSVCRQLGYTHAKSILDALPGSGLIWVDAVTCDDSAPCFKACYKAHHWSHACNHTQDVAVQCSYDISQSIDNGAGSPSKCKISVFPMSLLVLVVMMILSCLVAMGCGAAIILTAIRCCYRRKYSPRLYDPLE